MASWRLVPGGAASLGAFAFAVAMLSPVTAWSRDPVRVRLRYERTTAAGACTDEPGLRDAVAARLGYDPFAASADGQVVIAMDRRAGEWRARIELEDAAHAKKGGRSLTSSEKSCDELVSAVSLAVALAIDPLGLVPPTPPPPPPREDPAPPPREDPPPGESRPKEQPPPSVAPGPRGVWFVSAGGFVAGGVVPSLSFGPRLGFGIYWPRWSIALDGVYVAPGSEDSTSGNVEASVLAGGVRPCLRLGPDAVHVDACARTLFGGLFGEASRVGISTPSTNPYAAVGPEVAVELAFGEMFGLRLHGGALAALTKTFLRIREAGRDVDVWTSPAFSATAGIDGVLNFR